MTPLLASGASLADQFPGSPFGRSHAARVGLILAPGTGLATAPAFPAPAPTIAVPPITIHVP